jgi:hypothetical protein
LKRQLARLKETSMRLVITSDTHGNQNLIGSLPEGGVFVRAGMLVKNGYL